jgi:hypothetical protein
MNGKLPPATPKVKNSSLKKPYKGQVHTPASPKGMGDYYGTGIVAKLGKMRGESMGMQALSSTQMKKPPKSLA